MGLDMYLSKRHYVQNWDHMTPEERHQIVIKKGGKIHPFIDPEKITYITEKVGYWRKANAIHQWFVDNVQNGVDECQEAHLYREHLEKLLEVCKKVKEASVLVDAKVADGYSYNEDGSKNINYVDGKKIADPSVAEELLPSQEGFFFGSTDYDQYYLDDINQTIEILEAELSIDYGKRGFDQPEYIYQSSW